jgi:hypothetical protein
MAEVHQLVPLHRPFLASRQWAGPEGGNIVILPCIRRERLSDLRPLTREDRVLSRRLAGGQDEQSA